MFTVHIYILFIALISCEQEGCRKIPINGDKIFGECCVFILDKNLRYGSDYAPVTEINEKLTQSINSKNRQPPQQQKIEEIRPFQRSTEFFPYNNFPRPENPDYIRPKNQNVFTPPPQNIVISIKDDLLHGECSVFMEYENLPNENSKIIIAMIKDHLLMVENGKDTQPRNKKIAPLLSGSVSSNISPRPTASQFKPDNRQMVYTSKPLQNVQIEEISKSQTDHNISTVINSFNILTSKVTLESSSTPRNNKQKEIYKHKIKNSSVLEEETDLPTFFNKTTEEASTESNKWNPSNLNQPNYTKILFPTEASISTTTNGPILNMGNVTVKTIVDVGNRNAVDVPEIRCPTGQSKDPSGACVSPF